MHREPNLSRARKALWLAIVFSVGCGIAWSFYPLAGAAERLHAVPIHCASFSGEDVPLTERELKVLGRVDVLHRRYTNDARSLYVTVIDGSRDRHAVHDPRYCFRGAGWKVLEEKQRPIQGGHATWISAVNDERRAEAVFWFADGERRHSSMPRYLLDTTLRRVSLGKLGGKSVLVVLQSFDPTPLEWSEVESLVTELRL